MNAIIRCLSPRRQLIHYKGIILATTMNHVTSNTEPQTSQENRGLLSDVVLLPFSPFLQPHTSNMGCRSMEEYYSNMKTDYAATGIRQTVKGVMVTNCHNHPHVLLLKNKKGASPSDGLLFQLPGGTEAFGQHSRTLVGCTALPHDGGWRTPPLSCFETALCCGMYADVRNYDDS